MSPNNSKNLDAAAQNIPEEVTAWLGRLVLLYGVPFHYLIPDEPMLPKESIRFFFLDPIWVQCLVQGACSVGNTGHGDTLVDMAMNKLMQLNQPDGNGKVSLAGRKVAGICDLFRKAAGIRDLLRQQYEGVEPPEEAAELHWPLTGFLLRSAVVTGWRGLEIMAYKKVSDKMNWPANGLTPEQSEKLKNDGVAPLKALRIEQLSGDIMLGIFNGIIAQLVIRQPQEGLHFGLTKSPPEKGESYTKTLRELGYKNPAMAGEKLQDKENSQDVEINLSSCDLIRDKGRRVVNIQKLADKIKQELSGLGQLKPDELKPNNFTSAEFAVEMIEAPGEFTFRPNAKKSQPDG